LWQRIATTSALIAPLGWAAGRFTGAGLVVVGTSAGTVVGAFGLRPQKVALGPLVGAAVGLAAARRRGVPPAAVASTTVLAYRLLSAGLFRDAQMSLLAERARVPTHADDPQGADEPAWAMPPGSYGRHS
jgi:uncharacterized protein YqgC (DUF456 family)